MAYDLDKGLFIINSSLSKDKRLEFKDPLVEVNLETGEGYCNIRKYWERENVVIENVTLKNKKEAV
ncbi:hypothetical protein [Maledivibacter halophilus]|uniref:Uncharacterized protein n=1 Tax=Maledivibacter halophilus TaxID=36842 RepID=A0A1T5L6N7_9FIRM|nr:hypothetical protein [Maledivibacter halophilus]SKC68538.1 hypothetical protein SAMN02194393_02159 [Maledivibacter halophilus]SKC71594.1 hypothetical protein SAMN02194393_02493 [Maledivibacter halophilus]SKC80260.1 hypothetical protein SAMN02194393_03470 [Maledivibacter halophilus]